MWARITNQWFLNPDHTNVIPDATSTFVVNIDSEDEVFGSLDQLREDQEEWKPELETILTERGFEFEDIYLKQEWSIFEEEPAA